MKFFQRISILLFLMPALFVSTVYAKGTGLNMITEVQVICRRDNNTIARRYVQPHKIEAILNYLRLLKCSGRTDTDPEQLNAASFEIVLQDASGQRSIYRQRANRFLSKNAKPWERVSQEQASRLYYLIQAMPSDLPEP